MFFLVCSIEIVLILELKLIMFDLIIIMIIIMILLLFITIIILQLKIIPIAILPHFLPPIGILLLFPLDGHLAHLLDKLAPIMLMILNLPDVDFAATVLAIDF